MEKHTGAKVIVLTEEEEREMEKNTIYFEDYAPLDNNFTKEELSKIFDQIRQDIKNGVRRR